MGLEVVAVVVDLSSAGPVQSFVVVHSELVVAD
jgi:hypothetical protein